MLEVIKEENPLGAAFVVSDHRETAPGLENLVNRRPETSEFFFPSGDQKHDGIPPAREKGIRFTAFVFPSLGRRSSIPFKFNTNVMKHSFLSCSSFDFIGFYFRAMALSGR